MNNKELETKVADALAPFFKDPIDISCPYCEAAKAVIPIIQAEIGKKLYDIIVESSEQTDLTLEGEKRKLVFICNKLRPLINNLLGSPFKEGEA